MSFFATALRRFRPLALLLLLVLPIGLRAQQVLLTGVVVDAISGQPVPFAVVEIRARKVGVQATEQGTFSLAVPAMLAATDSLAVSSLGFATKVVAVPRASPCRLALPPLAVALPEAVVRATAAVAVRLGPTLDDEPYGFGNGRHREQDNAGWQVARQFTNGPTGTIQSVRFYLKPSLEHR